MPPPLRCPHCNSRKIERMLAAMFERNPGATWYRCESCRRVWLDTTLRPLFADSNDPLEST